MLTVSVLAVRVLVSAVELDEGATVVMLLPSTTTVELSAVCSGSVILVADPVGVGSSWLARPNANMSVMILETSVWRSYSILRTSLVE